MSKKAPVPSWLNITEDGVIVTLRKPIVIDGVTVDKLTMREPTVRDIRAASAMANGDDEVRELNLLSSLTQVGQGALDSIGLRNYKRLQEGYFRVVEDDEL